MKPLPVLLSLLLLLSTAQAQQWTVGPSPTYESFQLNGSSC